MPVSLELELLEEGLSTTESDHNNVNQQSDPDGKYIPLFLYSSEFPWSQVIFVLLFCDLNISS